MKDVIIAAIFGATICALGAAICFLVFTAWPDEGPVRPDPREVCLWGQAWAESVNGDLYPAIEWDEDMECNKPKPCKCEGKDASDG